MKIKYEAMIKIEITEEINEKDTVIPHPKKTFDRAIENAIKDEFSGKIKTDIFSKINVEK